MGGGARDKVRAVIEIRRISDESPKEVGKIPSLPSPDDDESKQEDRDAKGDGTKIPSLMRSR
jgi:hypothetical protein